MKNLLKLSLVLALALVLSPVALAQTAGGPSAIISSPANNISYAVNQSINFVAADAGTSGPYSYVWSLGDGGANLSGQNFSRSYTATGTKTVSLTVSDTQGRTDTKQISLNITEVATTTTLAITNVQAGNLTATSVTITWTTNLPATSRVIYDTASHAGTIDPATGGPNYGYVNSTTADSALVTSHSVVVSGLSANTKYYFRVISTN
ncbi:MAG: PKD domain-containing protein [Patescibacteria group bacterium]